MASSSSVGYRLRDRSLEGKKQLVFEGGLGIEGLGFRESCKLNEKPNRRNKKQTNWKNQKYQNNKQHNISELLQWTLKSTTTRILFVILFVYCGFCIFVFFWFGFLTISGLVIFGYFVLLSKPQPLNPQSPAQRRG